MTVRCVVRAPVRAPVRPVVLNEAGAAAGYSGTLLTGLVSWWGLDETSGTRADSHGSNDLTDNNTVGSTTGVVSNGADFVSANSEYLSLANASASGLQMGTSDWAISAWVYIDTAIDNLFEFAVSFGGNAFGTTSEGYAIYWSSGGQFVAQFCPTGATTVNATNNTFTNAAWNHVVANYDRDGNLTLRINDSTDGSSSISTHSAEDVQCSNDFRIGRNSFRSDYMNLAVDEVAIFQRLLTSEEITELYNSGAGMAYPG